MLEPSIIIIDSNTKLFLQQATEDDLPFIKRINYEEMDNVVQRAWVGGFRWEPWFNDIENAIVSPYHRVFVIEKDNEKIGTLWVSNDDSETLWITAIVIGNDWQRLGIGTRILHFLIEEAKKHGKKNIELGVQRNNTKAEKFYKSLGFKKFDYLRYANTDLLRLDIS